MKINKKILLLSLLLLCFVIAVAACSGKEEPEEEQQPEPVTPTPVQEPVYTPTPTPYPEIDYQQVRPYEAGQIMIIMYHGITEGPAPSSYQRNAGDFRQDLQDLYDNGFRTLSMADYINNNIITLPGYIPVIITFDDGLSSTFSLVEQNGTLVPREGTAVAIMEEFYEEYPEFGKAATMYISGKDSTFDGDGTFAERLNWLVSNGYDIGNHTWDHGYLNDLTTAEAVQRQFALTDKAIKDAVPGYTPLGISYPFGLMPIESLRIYLRSGEHDGHQYSYDFALSVGDSGYPSAPNRNDYDPFRLPRVRGSNDEETDLGWKLFVQYPAYPDLRYVSDGNPNRIAVPQVYSHNINPGSLGDKELYIYEYDP